MLFSESFFMILYSLFVGAASGSFRTINLDTTAVSFIAAPSSYLVFSFRTPVMSIESYIFKYTTFKFV